MQAHAAGQRSIHNRTGLIQSSSARSCHVDRERPNLTFRPQLHVNTLHPLPAIDPDTGGVDEHICHIGVRHKRSKVRSESAGARHQIVKIGGQFSHSCTLASIVTHRPDS